MSQGFGVMSQDSAESGDESTLSQPFAGGMTEEQAKAFAVLDGILERGTKKATDWSFFFGVTNALLIAWSMAAIPQHMWLIYMVDATVLFFLRIRDVCKPKSMVIVKGVAQDMNRFFYLFEFCYYANFAGIFVLICLALNCVTEAVAEVLFGAAFGIGCGTLLGATALFRNKILFHDLANTVSILIHLLPSMVMYSLRWDYKSVAESWGYLFHRGPFDDIPLLDIYKYSALFYLSWLIPYIVWISLHGRKVPARKDFDTCLGLNRDGRAPYDTCFHFNMRDPATGMGDILICRVFGQSAEELCRKRIEHDFSVSEIWVYNCGHAALALGLVSLSLACYRWKLFHQVALALVSLQAIFFGSGVYAKHIAFTEQYKNIKTRIQSA